MRPDQDAAPDLPLPPRAAPPPASLKRELTAILVLYVVLSVLPLLIGLAFGP